MLTSIQPVLDALSDLPQPAPWLIDVIDRREKNLIKPHGSLGRLEELTRWYGGWRGTKLNRSHIIVFAGNHGVVAQGVTAWPSDVTTLMVDAFARGRTAINQLAVSVGATLEVVTLEDLRPTQDITVGPAMENETFLAAIDAGFHAVSANCDLVIFGEMGIGNTTAAAAVSAALFGGDIEDWVGRGAGGDDDMLQRKIDAVRRAVELHRPNIKSPLDAIRLLGGHELAAAMGATIAARQYSIPVILDGFIITSAVAPLYKISPQALDHCVLGHVSGEPGHRRLAELLNLRPLLDLGLRLGEGSGAALAIPLLKAALACHNGMARFEDIGIKDETA